LQAQVPVAQSTNSGALVMLPTPLVGSGVVQEQLSLISKRRERRGRPARVD
jgi:hypothetical protein